MKQGSLLKVQVATRICKEKVRGLWKKVPRTCKGFSGCENVGTFEMLKGTFIVKLVY